VVFTWLSPQGSVGLHRYHRSARLAHPVLPAKSELWMQIIVIMHQLRRLTCNAITASVVKFARHPQVLHNTMADVPAGATQQGVEPRTISCPASLPVSCDAKIAFIGEDIISGGSRCKSGTAESGNRRYQLAELWRRCMCRTSD
jgi:hypothetical protein